MDALTLVITILQLLCGLAVIVIVLFQSGKSAGLSGALAHRALFYMSPEQYSTPASGWIPLASSSSCTVTKR